MTTFNGTLDITVHDAKLTSSQHLSKQDPYCIVTLGSSGLKNLLEGERLGKEKFQTKVHNGAGQNPVWNESHSLSLKNMTFESHLKVKLYDKDVVKDDYLGVAKVNLDELLRFDNKGVQYFPLYKKGGLKSKTDSIGQVGVAVKFNCTEIPQGASDLKTQATEAMTRHDQSPMGVHGAYQQGHSTHLGGPQQSVPLTYEGPVQSVAPPTGHTTRVSDEIQTHHKPGVLGAVTGAVTGATLLHGHHGHHDGHHVVGHHHDTTIREGTYSTPLTSTVPTTTTTTTPMAGTGVTGVTGATDTGLMHHHATTTFNGNIDITISDAKILVTQHGSKQDPYCIVTLGSGGLKSMMEGHHLGKEKFKTKVHNGAGQHPIWNETHSLSLKNMKLDSHLEIRLYDKDVLKDDYIGITTLTLNELLPYNKKGVQYLPLWKKGALKQTTSEQIGQVGVGVVFNCTEFPQAQADMKSQATDTMIRKDQQLSGVSEPYQTAQPVQMQQLPTTTTSGPISTSTIDGGHLMGHHHTMGHHQSTVNQSLDTKPVHTHTSTTIPQTQAQGQVLHTGGHGQQYM